MYFPITGESEKETDYDEEDIARDTVDDAVVVLVTLDAPVALFPWTLLVESNGSSTITDKGEVQATSRVASFCSVQFQTVYGTDTASSLINHFILDGKAPSKDSVRNK